MAVVSPVAAVTVWFAGQLIVNGACVTMTLKLQLPPFVPEVTLTVVVPTGKNDPDGVLLVIDPQSPIGWADSKVTKAP